MSLPIEAHHLIVSYVGNRSDICTLCTVSKSFQSVAERALYNTLHMRDPGTTVSICNTLASQGRLSSLVEALTIFVYEVTNEDGDDVVGYPFPSNYWCSVADALRATRRLRFLNIHVDNGVNKSQSWILEHCTFQLQTFHCDLDWDSSLVSFLNGQSNLTDLYILDYNDVARGGLSDSTPAYTLNPSSLPNLSVLECTFTEAANALVPGRPVIRLKTCFSSSRPHAKRIEMLILLSTTRLSTLPLRSIDIGDPTLEEAFTTELLTAVVQTLPLSNLAYIGTLILPVGGPERLNLYSLLMRIPHLRCLEVEVSDWEPPPTTPPALRALASELRLYCPTIVCIVFVYEFERFVISVRNGICVVDNDVNTDNLWREA